LFLLENMFGGQSAFFFNPEVPSSAHTAVLEEVLDGRVDPLTLEFLKLLAQRRLLRALPAIRLYYDDLVRKAAGDITVLLSTPYPPEDGLLAQIKEYLGKSGLYPESQADRAKFEVVIDKGLIGGFRAQYNGFVIDESLKARLDKACASWRQGA